MEQTGQVAQDLKYFTPSIEDIRVGYECEMSWNGKDWRPTILREQDFEPHSWYDHHEERRTYRKVEFRTPYLTKEQIEAEGWKYEGGVDGVPFFSKDDVHLTFFPEKMTMTISKFQFLSHALASNYDRFYCTGLPCKDKNTFRYICKLLGI